MIYDTLYFEFDFTLASTLAKIVAKLHPGQEFVDSGSGIAYSIDSLAQTSSWALSSLGTSSGSTPIISSDSTSLSLVR